MATERSISHAVRRTSAPLSALLALALLGACGGSSKNPAASTRPASSATIDLSEFTIATNNTTLPTGKVKYTITNKGKAQHELVIFHTDLALDAFPLNADGAVNEDGPGLVNVSDGEDIDAGKSQTRTVDFSEPGTYFLVCNLPGHFKAGMHTKVVVSS